MPPKISMDYAKVRGEYLCYKLTTTKEYIVI